MFRTVLKDEDFRVFQKTSSLNSGQGHEQITFNSLIHHYYA